MWQVHRAFLTLLRADFGDAVQVETVDDVAVFRDGRSVRAVQTKHSLNETTLTLASVEWWKTLRVWLDHSDKGLLHDDADLVLCTTSALSTDMSIFESSPPRADAVVGQLLDSHDCIAAARTNTALQSAYDVWTAASVQRRRVVLARARIEPDQCRLAENRAEINAELRRFGIPAGAAVDTIRDRLLGWFDSTLGSRLASGGCELRYEELNEQLTELRYEMNPRALPCAHSQAPTPSLENERYSDPTYLRQLNLLGASDDDLALAVSMYHRATAERDHWLEGRITAQGALRNYDADLVNAWQQKRSYVERAIGRSAEIERGWRLLDACMEYRGTVNGVSAPTHVANGTFHILANHPDDPPQLGWHPRYPELLRTKAP